MGWKVHIVNELPTDVMDIKEEPYNYDDWLQAQSHPNELSSSGTLSTLLAFVLSFLLL